MKLSDVRGEVDLDPEAAISFITNWFHAEDLITFVGRRSVAEDRYNTLSASMTAMEFVQLVREDPESFRGLVFDSEGGTWNLYVGVCPVKEPAAPTQRGTEDNVLYVPGVWADIDVKAGSFESTEDIIEFLGELELEPTMICGSGSGGVHAYWRLHWGTAGDKQLIEQWWSYLAEKSAPRVIDKLIDVTRILRVPGSVNFPKQTGKADADTRLKPVVLYRATGKTYSAEEIRAVSNDAFERRRAARKALIHADSQRRFQTDALMRQVLSTGLHNRWRMFRAIAFMEDYYNSELTWDEILTPYGWQWLRTLRDGSNEWARPGRAERSAVVDFEDSPVMSLLSSSEETGLSDLKDAGIALTKFRVLLRLHFDDNHEALVQDFLARMDNK
jgi:hypothetical protein